MKISLFIIFLVLIINTKAQTWAKVSDGDISVVNSIYTIKEINNKLYVGAQFVTQGQNRIASWNDTAWQYISNLPFYSVFSFNEYNNLIYVGGRFNFFAGNYYLKGLANWDGTKWDSAGYFTNSNAVKALAVYKNELYVAGNFTFISGVSYKGIARWNGTEWNDVGGGIDFYGLVDGGATCMTVYNNELIVAGNITGSYTAYSPNIVRWDGTQWYPMLNGLDGNVYGLEVDTVSNILYVCGYFFNSLDGVACKYIARWDGSNWSALGNETYNYHGIYNYINSLKIYNNKLFAGGGTNNPDSSLACWDGSIWQTIFGPNSDISSLEVYNNKLFVAGYFTQVGNDTSMKYIASYYDTIIGHLSTSISSFSIQNSSFNIYPNPTDSQFTIETSLSQGNEGIIKIFNIKGELKKTISINTENKIITLDVSDWEKGTYICVLEQEGKQVESKKFLIN